MSRLMKSWPIAVAILATMTYAVAEDITMTTFYPSPRGVYNQLRTMGQTTLAETAGNVGVGLVAPGSRLTVQGIGTTNATSSLSVTNSTPTSLLFVRDDGNVGIGTVAPNQKLEVNGVARFTTGAGGTFSIGGDAGIERVQTSAAAPTIRFLDTTNAYATLGMRGLSVGGAYGATAAPANGAIVEGNVGIGTTGPGEKLQVEGNIALGAGNALTTVPGNDLNLNVPAARSLFVKLAGATKIAMDNQGNVGIGTTTPGTKLEVAGSIRGNVAGAVQIDTGNGTLQLGPQNGGWSHFVTDRPRYYFNTGVTVDTGAIGSYDEDLSLQTQGTTRLTILNANGNVGIGTTAPTSTLHVAGNIFATGSISVPSDGRFKTAVAPLTGALEKLDAIQAISFERNALGQALGQPGGRRELGVLAQELEQSYPELVTASGPEAYRAVDYSRLTVVLLEAVKELRQENRELKHQNAALEQRVTTLEAQRP